MLTATLWGGLAAASLLIGYALAARGVEQPRHRHDYGNWLRGASWCDCLRTDT